MMSRPTIIVLCTICAVAPGAIDVVGQDQSGNPVVVDEQYTLVEPAADDKDVKEGDKRSRIQDLVIGDEWLIIRLRSDVAFANATPLEGFRMPWRWKTNYDRLIAINLITGKRTSIIVNPEVRDPDIDFGVPVHVGPSTFEFTLSRSSEDSRHALTPDDLVRRIKWNLRSEQLSDISELTEMGSRLSRFKSLLEPAGLSLTAKKEPLTGPGSFTASDLKTGNELNLPIEWDKLVENASWVGSPLGGGPSVFLVPGAPEQRLVVVESFEEESPTISAYDPNHEHGLVWRVRGIDVEEACSKPNCDGIYPANQISYPAQRLTFLATFKKQPSSVVSLSSGGNFEWSCEVPAFEKWDNAFVSQNDRFLALQGTDYLERVVLIDFRSRTVSDPLTDETYLNYGIAGVLDNGQVLLTSFLSIAVMTFEGEWTRTQFIDLAHSTN